MNKVIDIGEARFTRKENKPCAHRHLLCDPREKTLECEDCGRTVDPFQALWGIVREIDQEWEKIRRARKEDEEMRRKGLTLKAAKAVETAWRRRSMVPTCPHCHEAIFPEDGFGRRMANKKMARERRVFRK